VVGEAAGSCEDAARRDNGREGTVQALYEPCAKRYPDGLFALARAAGAEITSELHDTDYGSRDFAARDPEGDRWSFGTYRGELRKPA
jgi:uncharacterized glyoxalase superfamily protein PhnB